MISADDLSPQQLADLAALADESIAPTRRKEVEAWIASSPELEEIFRREQAAVELVHEARALDRAPHRLRVRIEHQRHARRRVRSRGFAVSLAGAIGAGAVALALALPPGTPGSPTVSEAAALALRGPVQAAPAVNPKAPRWRLAQAVQDVYFPNWSTSLQWRAIGQRRDRLGHRLAITVFYASGASHLAYTIVGGPALPAPRVPGAVVHGFDLRALKLNGRTILTWRRGGHTCVISARGVQLAAMQRLAAWRAPAISL